METGWFDEEVRIHVFKLDILKPDAGIVKCFGDQVVRRYCGAKFSLQPGPPQVSHARYFLEVNISINNPKPLRRLD